MPNLGGNALFIKGTEDVQIAGVAPAGLEGQQVGGAYTIHVGEDWVLNESRLSEKSEVRQAYVGSAREMVSLWVCCRDELHSATVRCPAAMIDSTDGDEAHSVEASAERYHHSLVMDKPKPVVI